MDTSCLNLPVPDTDPGQYEEQGDCDGDDDVDDTVHCTSVRVDQLFLSQALNQSVQQKGKRRHNLNKNAFQ